MFLNSIYAIEDIDKVFNIKIRYELYNGYNLRIEIRD